MKLKNSEIVGAKTSLAELFRVKLPVRTSLKIAELDVKLNKPIDAFAKVRDSLMEKYEVKRSPILTVDGQVQFTSAIEGNLEKFVEEFNELLEVEVNLVFEKIRLPEKIAATCDQCHHNMDKPLEIEPATLLALIDFVEIY